MCVNKSVQQWLDLAVLAHVSNSVSSLGVLPWVKAAGVSPEIWRRKPVGQQDFSLPGGLSFLNIFMDRLPKCLHFPLKITIVWNCFRHQTPQRGQLPQLKVNLWAKRAKRVQKTRSRQWSWASRKAANRKPESSQTPGSSKQPRPTPSRTEETHQRNPPPTRGQRRGSHLEGFLRALYVNLILSVKLFLSWFKHPTCKLLTLRVLCFGAQCSSVRTGIS